MPGGVPGTVEAALEDRPVAGATCLEAGAGADNATAGLLEAGGDRVYAVAIDPEHATLVRERVAGTGEEWMNDGDERTGDGEERTLIGRADIRALPIADDAADIVTAHGLFNVLPPSSLPEVVPPWITGGVAARVAPQ